VLLDILISFLSGVPFVEKYYENEGLVRHYLLPNGQILEVVLA
jgi:hypothetical protein